MKEYNIFKRTKKDLGEAGGDIYYSNAYETFFRFACRLIIEGDSYRVEGDDDKIISLLKRDLEFYGNGLGIPTHGTDGNIKWSGIKPVTFEDKMFPYAVQTFASEHGYIYGRDHYELVKVNNLADVKRVKKEYKEKNRGEERKAA